MLCVAWQKKHQKIFEYYLGIKLNSWAVVAHAFSPSTGRQKAVVFFLKTLRELNVFILFLLV